MARQVGFDAALASAESALAREVIDLIDVSADWAEANRKLGMVRPYCRQLRAAIVELDRSESAHTVEYARTFCRKLRTIFLELEPATTIPFHCDDSSCSLTRSPRTTCWLKHLEGMLAAHSLLETSANRPIPAPAASPAQAMEQSGARSSTKAPMRNGARAGPSVLRQAIGFLALILAYLKFYLIDVQLQIMTLPCLFP